VGLQLDEDRAVVDSKSGLIFNRILDRNKFEDVTEEYKNPPYVVSAKRLFDKEISVS
jgi:hypothetical protein